MYAFIVKTENGRLNLALDKNYSLICFEGEVEEGKPFVGFNLD